MHERRSLIPSKANAARPLFLFLAVSLSLIAIIVAVGLFLGGSGPASIVWSMLLFLAITVIVLALTKRYAAAMDRDAARLATGEIWAEWTLTPGEYRQFVDKKRRGANRQALLLALTAGAVGIGILLYSGDRLAAAIFGGVVLYLAGAVFFLSGPPRGARRDADRRVRVGPLGAQALGRYQPLAPKHASILEVRLVPGRIPVLEFHIRTGQRLQEVHIPVPLDRLRDAEVLADRYRREYHL